ncbi:alpha/beta hydrolase fold domain-containing protein [Nonomuraea sp. NPDC050786]|uniref:alpha/beta hydrolase fold domain-containing protein n=1 Tax=Nonomuraea sp. NPDC050786 TaxID=3154840 RepID=UPI0033EEB915
MSEVLVVVGPGLVADAGLLQEIATREFATLGVSGTLVHARDASHVLALLTGAASAVVLPGPSDEVRGLIGRPLGAVVWVDVERADGVRAGAGAAHLHGRGINGLAWGIRHAVHRERHPSRRIAYGELPDQWGELYLPGGPEGGRAVPVVVLVHGGYWRSIWAADLMEPLCADLAGRGFAVWNLEYRRPDLHGWQATTADVAAGLAALTTTAASPGGVPPGDGPGDRAIPPGFAEVAGFLDLGKVAVVGHSAGAQLALRAAADRARAAGQHVPDAGADAARAAGQGVPGAGAGPERGAGRGAVRAGAVGGEARIVLAVSLAGVLDLVQGDRRWLSSGAVASALGAPAPARLDRPAPGHPAPGHLTDDEAARLYAESSPLLRLPLHVRQLIVQGTADDLDLVDFSRRHARAAKESGDDVIHVEMPGDHFDVINPGTPIWQATARAIGSALRQ